MRFFRLLTSFSAAALLTFAAVQLTAASAQAPSPVPQIYSDTADAHADLAAALATAKQTHRHVLLDFGGNWCGDCKVLDIYIHQSPNAELLAKNYVLVHVNIGRYDKNQDLADKYNVPLKKGVPALAVLDGNGKEVFVQRTGEFEDMRHMQPSSLTDFLNKWKPQG